MFHIKPLPLALGVLLASAAIAPLATAQNSMGNNQQHSQKWNQMDANGDGAVSMDEYTAYARRMFQQADTNGDGSIDQDEGHAAMQKMHHSDNNMDMHKNMNMNMDSKFSRMWSQVDTDGDGVISMSEDMAHHKQMFERADTNHDNQLSQSEWQSMRMMKMHDNDHDMDRDDHDMDDSGY